MPQSADAVIETLETAKEENLLSRLRQEQLVNLPAQGEVWMTGDIHDNRNNFRKIVRKADLGNNPQRHLVLHELIHGDHFDANGAEDSWVMLVAAAELKCDFPDQVHFMLANHDLAQIHGEGIMKSGLSVCEAFRAALKRDFPDKYHRIEATMSDFFLSFPLGIRCQNGLLFTHSLPTDKEIDTFDYTVFDRPLKGEDYRRKTGPAYQLIWGRHMSEETVDKFAQNMKARIVINGHQPQEMGYATNGPRQLIIASDHNQGVYLPLNLSVDYTMQELVSGLRKIVGISFDEDE